MIASNDILWQEPKVQSIEFRGSFFEKKILRCEEKFKNKDFIGYTLSTKALNSQEDSLTQTTKVFYPLIDAISKVNSNMLPELMDVFVCESENAKKLVLVMEYIKGYPLKDAINKYLTYKKKQADSYTINISNFSKLLKKLTYFSEDLLNEGYAYLGFFPSHLILQKSDVLRITGLRFILKTEKGIVKDSRLKSLENEIKYSFMPMELYTKMYEESKGPINALAVLAYQIGILILWAYHGQNLGKYRISNNQIELSDEIFEIIPYKEREKVSDAVWALLDPDPDIRMNTLQEIRDCLESLE